MASFMPGFTHSKFVNFRLAMVVASDVALYSPGTAARATGEGIQTIEVGEIFAGLYKELRGSSDEVILLSLRRVRGGCAAAGAGCATCLRPKVAISIFNQLGGVLQACMWR